MKHSLFVLFLFCALQANAQQPYRAVLFNGLSQSTETRLMAMTLAGIVNRDSARLYLLNVYETWSYTQTDERWRDIYRSRGNVQFDSIASYVDLVNRFRPFINGAITYDANRFFSNFTGQNFRWQGEYAALIGGLTNRLPLTAAVAQALGLDISDSVLVTDAFDGDPPVYVPGRLEASANPWNNPSLTTEEQRYLTILDWGVQKLLPRCNPKKFYIREITDWTIRHRMFQVNLAGTDDLDFNSMPAARADILERVLNFMHAKNPATIFHIYGWIRPEPMTQWFAFFGSSFHETLLGNLSWHSSFPVAQRTFIPPGRVNPDSVRVQNKHYLLFVGSEGDASNWVFGFQGGAWLSPQRGSVPVGWGWNIHLFNECPFVAAYYYDTATPNDGFLSVTSPLGYAYPDLWQNDVWQGAIDSTRHLKNRFGVHDAYGYKHYAATGTMTFRGKTISNSFNFTRYAQFQSAVQTDLTILYDPLLPSQTPITSLGPLMFNHTGDGSFYGDASNLTTYANRILNAVRGRSKPSFLLAGYQRFRQDDFGSRTSPGASDINMPRLNQIALLLAADTSVGRDIEIVTPERFSVLMRKRVGLLSANEQRELPETFVLMPAYPNPFNPATTIRYGLPRQTQVTLSVYDIMGREVRRLVDGVQAGGFHSVTWDGHNNNGAAVSSGVYLCRLQAGTFNVTTRLVLVR